jgi:hypothetical protein
LSPKTNGRWIWQPICGNQIPVIRPKNNPGWRATEQPKHSPLSNSKSNFELDIFAWQGETPSNPKSIDGSTELPHRLISQFQLF